MPTNSNHFKTSEKNSIELFKLLTRCINKFSEAGVKEMLKDKLSMHPFSEGKIKAITEHIITCVLEEYEPFGVTRADLLKSSKRGHVSEARKICIVLIKKNINITTAKITNYFGNKSSEIIFRIIRDHHKIDRTSKIKPVVEFLKKYDAIEKRVNLFVLELKNSSTEAIPLA